MLDSNKDIVLHYFWVRSFFFFFNLTAYLDLEDKLSRLLSQKGNLVGTLASIAGDCHMAIIDMKGAAREKQVADYWKVVFGEEKLNQRNLNSLYQPSKFY